MLFICIEFSKCIYLFLYIIHVCFIIKIFAYKNKHLCNIQHSLFIGGLNSIDQIVNEFKSKTLTSKFFIICRLGKYLKLILRKWKHNWHGSWFFCYWDSIDCKLWLHFSKKCFKIVKSYKKLIWYFFDAESIQAKLPDYGNYTIAQE